MIFKLLIFNCNVLRFIFPEFLPDPEPSFRNSVAERLQRQDMIARREVVEIPGEAMFGTVRLFLSPQNSMLAP